MKVFRSGAHLLLSAMLLAYVPADARRADIIGETEVKAGKLEQAVKKLEALERKGADEWYLLGRTYLGLGKKVEARKAWTVALQINNKISGNEKWTFLFLPQKNSQG